jgi:electron transfer flavoprotein alpha subunit
MESLPVAEVRCRTRLIERRAVRSARPELGAARVVVSGGRALGSKEHFALIDALADKLGAASGHRGPPWMPVMSPTTCRWGRPAGGGPELYIAVGISGAIQHLAGMKESR